jgi:hypothetical protein
LLQVAAPTERADLGAGGDVASRGLTDDDGGVVFGPADVAHAPVEALPTVQSVALLPGVSLQQVFGNGVGTDAPRLERSGKGGSDRGVEEQRVSRPQVTPSGNYQGLL